MNGSLVLFSSRAEQQCSHPIHWLTCRPTSVERKLFTTEVAAILQMLLKKTEQLLLPASSAALPKTQQLLDLLHNSMLATTNFMQIGANRG